MAILMVRGCAREEGATPQHARLQQAPRGPQEELHIMPTRKLRQPRVQLCRHHHRPRQVRVHLPNTYLAQRTRCTCRLSAHAVSPLPNMDALYKVLQLLW